MIPMAATVSGLVGGNGREGKVGSSIDQVLESLNILMRVDDCLEVDLAFLDSLV